MLTRIWVYAKQQNRLADNLAIKVYVCVIYS